MVSSAVVAMVSEIRNDFHHPIRPNADFATPAQVAEHCDTAAERTRLPVDRPSAAHSFS